MTRKSVSVTWSNVFAGVLLVWWGATCSGCTTATMPTPAYFTVVVISQHWSADAVRVFCRDGQLIGVIRGVRLNGRTEARFRRTCEEVRFEIETFDGALYRHPAWALVYDTLEITIGPQLVFTHVRERAA